MSIEGQGHFFTIYFPGFVCFVLDKAMISGERLQDHWSSGLKCWTGSLTNEPLGERSNTLCFAPREHPDQHGHQPSLIRDFADCIKKA